MKELTTTRPDIDIEADIHHVLGDYPPVVNDRHHIQVTVEDGHVIINGYTRTAVTHGYVMSRVPEVHGVISVDASEFYSDENLRLTAARDLPYGVFARLEYGTVILYGTLPDDADLEQLVQHVGSVPGVRRVVTSFDQT
jgi:osmotically-inducible protein OsmY